MRAADSPSTGKEQKSREIARRNTGHIQTYGWPVLCSVFCARCPMLYVLRSGFWNFCAFWYFQGGQSRFYTPQLSCVLLWLVSCPGSSFSSLVARAVNPGSRVRQWPLSLSFYFLFFSLSSRLWPPTLFVSSCVTIPLPACRLVTLQPKVTQRRSRCLTQNKREGRNGQGATKTLPGDFGPE